MPNTVPAIQIQGLSKSFGSVAACQEVSLTLRRGEILALLGENGSGKTTLMNMLSGLYRPDHGSIYVDGHLAEIHGPKDAQRLGIGMIHQHFKLVDVLTAKQNIILGMPKKRGQGDAQLSQEIRELSARFGLEVDPDQKIYEMSVSQKQTVEILKVLYRGADILILDEPTAVLTPQEADRLFEILRKMRTEGCAVIIITHKLAEVMSISDRVTILRGGRSIDTVETPHTSPAQLTEKMVGHKVDLAIERPETKKAPLLQVQDLTVINAEGIKQLDQVSFALSGGEILGVAGVAGSGQKQLCECIAGLVSSSNGHIVFKGQSIEHNSPQQIYDLGVRLGFIPEDRLGMGLVGSMDIVDNLLLREYRKQPGFFVRRKPARKRAEELVERLQIATPSVLHRVSKLSGGNVQKVLLGRELQSAPELLVTAYVVRGLDIHSSYTIYDLINEQKRKGVATLFVGEDLDVLLELCDRIMVLCGGRVTGIVDAKHATREQIGLMMVGQEAQSQ